MIKKTPDIKIDKPVKPATINTGTTKPVEKKPLDTHTAKTPGDHSTISKETKEEKAKNLPNLNAFNEGFEDKKTEKGEKGKEGDKTDKTDKTGKKDEKKLSPEDQKKLDGLQAQLKEAEKKGDKEAIARLQKEIDALKNPPAKPGDNNGATPPAAGDNNGGTPPVGGNNGAAPPAGGDNGGGAPAGGNQGGAPAGGAPQAGGDPGGGAPAGGAPGGGAPAGAANEAGAGQQASSEEVRQFLQFAANAYGVNPGLLSEIARRESNFNTGDVANNWDSNAKKGTPSKGMFQFIQPTFQSMMPQAKRANPGAWQGVSENWTDWKAQALTCAWALSSGKGSHWSTFKSALASSGGQVRGNGGTAMA